MPMDSLAKSLLLPELKLIKIEFNSSKKSAIYYCQKKPANQEFCPRCSTGSNSTYDHRLVRIKDTPIRQQGVVLVILKRRLWCKPCRKTFTEYVPGIQKGHRTTDRYESALLMSAERYSNLSQLRKDYSCSSDFLYRALYKELERRRREQINYPWPKTLGIDEHAFKKNSVTKRTEFAVMVVDYSNRRLRELVHGKRTEDLKSALSHIPGRENVQQVAIDMCDPFKNFVREFFPQALLVADKFHVLRLLSPALLKKRKEICGTRADAKAKSLLLMSAKNLSYSERRAIELFLKKYPILLELYQWKERLHGFYRIRGYHKAERAFTIMTDAMAHSDLPEIKKLRKTFLKWRQEILNYFKTRLTNARTEGFNNKAKVVKRRGYGYKSFKNYRLRLLHACA
jgi:transposase